MAPKSAGKAAKGSKGAAGSSGAAAPSSVAVVGGAGASAGGGVLLWLYKCCLDGKPKEKLASLGAADRALQEMQELWKKSPSRLECLLLVRLTP